MRTQLQKALPYGVVVLAGLAVVIGASLAAPVAPKASASRGLTGDAIVATLQDGGRTYSGPLQAALLAARQYPDDRTVAKAAASLLIDEGRAAGDARLVGAAMAVLRAFMADPDAEVLYLAATARQYQHDFPAALTLLDAAFRLDPRDVNVILTRATLQIVRGRFDLAQADCNRLNTLSRTDIGFLCQATTRLLTADAPAIADRLATILARPGLLDPSLHGWARGLLGEMAALHGDVSDAQKHLAAVVSANPLALRERMLLADLLLADGRAAEVLVVLGPAIPADGVLIRRVLAARVSGETDLADRITADLEARFDQNIALGLTAHAREETLFYLRVAKDPTLALQRALVNWELQHEIEDAQLLVDAAMFAGQPEAAVPVVRWMAEQAVSVSSFRMPDPVRKAAQ